MPPEEDVDSAPVESTEDVSSVGEESTPVESSAAPVAEQQAETQYGVPELWGAFKSLPQFQGADDRAIAARLYESLQQGGHGRLGTQSLVLALAKISQSPWPKLDPSQVP